MTLLDQLADWRIEIFASDLSTRVLERAQAAQWPIDRAADIPERYLRAFMLRGTGAREGVMQAGPELRRLVRFARLNLHDERLAVEGRFELILCRNVLIYFSREGRSQVVRRLLEHLEPGGYLLLGHAETVHGLDDRLQPCGPSAYRWEP
jgi:chemotaxis protein methyltransferase CheR